MFCKYLGLNTIIVKILFRVIIQPQNYEFIYWQCKIVTSFNGH